jgi:hypothetical protein
LAEAQPCSCFTANVYDSQQQQQQRDRRRLDGHQHAAIEWQPLHCLCASVGPEVYSFARIERAYSKWPQSACKTRGARRPIQKKKKKSKAMTEARRNERAKCTAKVKERSGTRRRPARTIAADGGRQR